jgi:hypothetical protein
MLGLCVYVLVIIPLITLESRIKNQPYKLAHLQIIKHLFMFMMRTFQTCLLFVLYKSTRLKNRQG